MVQRRALRRRCDGLARNGGGGRGRARPESGARLTRAADGLGSKPIGFSGGPILTMADPLRVDALTVQGDRIVWAGTLEDCRAFAGLDRAATDREIYVMNVSGHGGCVNSFGLKAHGITAQTPTPAGGEIGRNPDGTPNGLLWDAACDLLTGPGGVKIRNHGPNIHLPEPADVAGRQLDRALDQFLRAGITTVVDAQVSRREAE